MGVLGHDLRMFVAHCFLIAAVVVLLIHSHVYSQATMPNPIPHFIEAIRTNTPRTIHDLAKEYPHLLHLPLNEEQHSALHIAAHHDALDSTQALLALGADFYARDRNQQLALDIAPGQSLNPTRANLRAINSSRNEYLAAVHNREVEKVRELLAADPSLARARDIGDGWSAVMTACHFGDFALLKALLDGHSMLDAADYNTQHTALAVAVDKGHSDCVELLLDAGVDASQSWPVPYGRLPMQMNALHLACWRGHTDIVSLLLKAGLDANARARSYAVFSPLHFAATEGHTDIVRLLLEHGADPTALDGRRGRTPLQMAQAANHAAVVRLLTP